MSVRMPPPDPNSAKATQSNGVSGEQYKPQEGNLGGHKVSKGFSLGKKFSSFINFMKGALMPSLNRPKKPIIATAPPPTPTPTSKTAAPTSRTAAMPEKKRPASEVFKEGELDQFNHPSIFMRAGKAVKMAESEQSKATTQLKELLNNPNQEFEVFGNYIVTRNAQGQLVDMGTLVQKSKIGSADAAHELGISAAAWNDYQKQALTMQSAIRPHAPGEASLRQLEEKYGKENPTALAKGIQPEKLSVEDGVVMVEVRELDRKVKVSDLLRDSGLTPMEMRRLLPMRELMLFCTANQIDPKSIF